MAYEQDMYDSPPQNKSGRRPHLSMAYSPGRVDDTLTALVIILITNGFVIPVFLKNCVP